MKKKDKERESLLKERDELKAKLVDFVEFVNSDKCQKLSAGHRSLLMTQKVSMEMYLGILNKRLFDDVENAPVGSFGLASLMLPMMLEAPFGNAPKLPPMPEVKPDAA